MSGTGLTLPARITGSATVQAAGSTAGPSLSPLLSSIEDGSMTAGGLLAGISVVVTADPNYIVLGLGIAAIGKAAPSVLESALQSKWWGLSDQKRTGLVGGDGHVDGWGTAADSWLLALGILAVVTFGVTREIRPFLFLIGAAFVGKALLDMVDDIGYAIDPARADDGANTSSRGSEDMLLFWFGFAAMVLVVAGPSAGLAASPALGLAALGKALPSLASSSKSSSSPSGAKPSSGSPDAGSAAKLTLTFSGVLTEADASPGSHAPTPPPDPRGGPRA
jgi:hypothetical protein